MPQTRTAFESYKAELRREWEGSLVRKEIPEVIPVPPPTLDMVAAHEKVVEQLYAHLGLPPELLAESYDGRCFY